jgi:hypothetical protein
MCLNTQSMFKDYLVKAFFPSEFLVFKATSDAMTCTF